jgi:RHS repeat-associated protein
MTYDAFGRMAEKLDAGVYNQFLYGTSGSLLARMNGQSVVSVRVPLLQSWAVYSATNTFHHYEHLDWLGNSRLSSNQSRQMVSDIAYAPFGEAYASTSSSGVSFTGMRSDVAAVSGSTTDGLYDFLARELPPTQGRWLSPDPAGSAAVSLANPQSWNRYGYVTNNPLIMADPLGLVNDCVACGKSIAGGGSTYYVNGMAVPDMAFGGYLLGQGGSGLTWAFAPGSGLGVYEYKWIPTHTEVTGSVDQDCDPSNVCASDLVYQQFAGHYDWLLVHSVAATRDTPVGMDIWHCDGCERIWRNTGQVSDPKTIAKWYGASALAGMIMIPSAGAAVAESTYQTWLTFENTFPGATEDILNILSPGPNIPATIPGAIVFGGQLIYDWYENSN